MEYSHQILCQIDFINSLLKEYDEQSIFDNNNIIVDEMSWSEYLKIKYNKVGVISFEIICSSSEFQINIDRTNEALDLSANDFRENRKVIKDYLNVLFTCRAKIVYCGSNYTKISFYDESEHCVKTLKYVTGLYLKIGCNTKEYPPIYTI